LSTSPLPSSTISSTRSFVVLGSLVEESKLLGAVLCHVLHIIISEWFITFLGNNLELLARHSSTFEFPVYRSIVNRYEAVSLQEIEELIQKPVRLVSDQTEQVLDIVEMKEVRASSLVAMSMRNHFTSRSPEP